jgi:hypothetical protein
MTGCHVLQFRAFLKTALVISTFLLHHNSSCHCMLFPLDFLSFSFEVVNAALINSGSSAATLSQGRNWPTSSS